MKSTIFSLFLLTALGTATAGVRFLHGPFADAMKLATDQNKPLLIDFMTDWCRWCDTLDANTYSDSTVSAFMAARVVSFKSDAEKGEGINLAKRYGIVGYPTILVVKTDGEEIDRITGYVPPEGFLAALKDCLNGVNTFSSVLGQAKKNPRDPALRYALAKKYADRNDIAASTVQFKELLTLDPGDSLGHNEEARFSIAIASLRLNKDSAPLASFVKDHPNSEHVRGALSTLFIQAIRSGDAPGARAFFEQYIERWPGDVNAMNNYAWNCAQRDMNLDHASGVAKTAVGLAANDLEKAEVLDTYATVQFKLGKTDEAVALEGQALDLMKDAPPNDRKGFELTLEKFKSSMSGAGSR